MKYITVDFSYASLLTDLNAEDQEYAIENNSVSTRVRLRHLEQINLSSTLSEGIGSEARSSRNRRAEESKESSQEAN